ncbi:MAG TPA: exonuclease domain-containing protein [Gaiellaceae bacterium]|nr:exonuclease domain-containing protein [Gaiellaceae bacterium]
MQLAFDAADRLVELLEERRGPVPAAEAARRLFALAHAPDALARSLLDDVVSGDARLAWRGAAVALAGAAGADVPLEHARFVVVDLETTGLSAGRDRICEIGAVRVDALALGERFETLVRPGARLPHAVASLTGIDERALLRAPAADVAVRRFLRFAGDRVLVAHNARFDVAFLDREVQLLTGRRLAAPVVDTVWLARRLLAGRASRVALAALARFFGTSVEPCHRALPDAQATAEILLALIGLAQERGAATVADLCDLATPQTRRVHAKRTLAAGAPAKPGVYLFRDAHDRVLYVGRARDLRARLRSYFASERQRPAVEAALGALERIEWRVLGSELEAALEELRLIRELRPPANARGKRAGVYLRRRGDGDWVVTETPAAPSNSLLLGPVRNRRRAALAARALRGYGGERPSEAVPALRAKLREYAECLRYEDAARLRDRVAALEDVCRQLAELEPLRAVDAWLLVPAREPGFRRAYLVSGGRVAAARTLPPGAGAELELAAAEAAAARAGATAAAEDAEELLLVGTFLRRPPPELAVVPRRPRAAAA